MFTIGKQFTFEAAHHLPHLPPEHKCSRPHGHSYTVLVDISASSLDDRGFVVDYGDLDPLADWIQREFDHRDLNDIIDPTTAEVLARYIGGYAQDILDTDVDRPLEIAVTVCETAKTFATWYA